MQLLTGDWKVNWSDLLSTPMGINSEKVWNHVSLRWEFQDGQSSALTAQDAQLVTNLIKILKQAY